MNVIKYRVSLDMFDTLSQITIKAKKCDSACQIHITLTDHGKIYNISEGCYATFNAKKSDGTFVYDKCSIEGNTIVYDFGASIDKDGTCQVSACEGIVECEVTLYTENSEQLTSPRFTLFIDGTVYNGEEILSTPESNVLKELINNAKNVIKNVDATARKAVAEAAEATLNNKMDRFGEVDEDEATVYLVAPTNKTLKCIFGNSFINLYPNGTMDTHIQKENSGLDCTINEKGLFVNGVKLVDKDYVDDSIANIDISGESVEIVDNLSSNNIDKALSANMGKVLNETKLDKSDYTETFDTSNNMLPIEEVIGNIYTQNGITLTVDKNGVFVINGTTEKAFSISIMPQGQYGTFKKGVTYKAHLKYLSGEYEYDGSITNLLYLQVTQGNNFMGVSVGARVSNNSKPEVSATDDTPMIKFGINFPNANITYKDFKVAPYITTKALFDENYTGYKTKFDISNLTAGDKIESEMLLVNYLNDEVDTVIAETVATGLDADISFLAFADPHSFEHNKYLKYAEIMKSGGIDFMVGLGDYVPYQTMTKENCLIETNKALSASGRGSNCYYAVGNHDAAFSVSNESLVLTKKEQHKLVCSHLNGAVHFNELDPYGCYYYADYDASKIRVIVLNTSDLYTETGELNQTSPKGKTLMISQKQLTWFAEKALNFAGKTTPTDWSVLVCGHVYYPLNTDMFPLILKAVKNGTALNQTWNDGGNNLYVNVDYSTQGAVDVIGFVYGHEHIDKVNTVQDIKCIQVRIDNNYLDNLYRAEINGVVAGDYYITSQSGKKHGFTLSQDYPTAKYAVYNQYPDTTYVTFELFDENNFRLLQIQAKTNNYTDSMTEIATNFTTMRPDGTAKTESCEIVNVNKDTRTITIIPYGLGDTRIINY